MEMQRMVDGTYTLRTPQKLSQSLQLKPTKKGQRVLEQTCWKATRSIVRHVIHRRLEGRENPPLEGTVPNRPSSLM